MKIAQQKMTCFIIKTLQEKRFRHISTKYSANVRPLSTTKVI